MKEKNFGLRKKKVFIPLEKGIIVHKVEMEVS